MQRTFTNSVIGVVLTMGAAGWAQAKPNFSGEWKMNAERSSFAPLPAPDKLLRKITQHGISLKMTTVQAGEKGEVTTDLAYTMDGKECRNKIRGQDVTGTARWDGDSLVVESRREVQGMQIVQSERWALSEDGQVLTIMNHVQTPQAGFDVTIVLEKQ